ncbi:MAG: hypothetical protein IJS54_07635 [Desulfovibrio sp.]|nr:hypothetical protein [Desulfovibrio sp.]
MRLLLLCLLLLAGCAAKSPPAPPPEECQELWILGPEHYLFALASGDTVWVNPKVQAFPVYCSKQKALKALAKNRQSKTSSAIFRLAATVDDTICFGEERLLFTPAKLTTWQRLPNTQ